MSRRIEEMLTMKVSKILKDLIVSLGESIHEILIIYFARRE